MPDASIFGRTRLGVDAKRSGGERQFSGIMDVYVKTIKADGLLGLYRYTRSERVTPQKCLEKTIVNSVME